MGVWYLRNFSECACVCVCEKGIIGFQEMFAAKQAYVFDLDFVI